MHRIALAPNGAIVANLAQLRDVAAGVRLLGSAPGGVEPRDAFRLARIIRESVEEIETAHACLLAERALPDPIHALVVDLLGDARATTPNDTPGED